MALDITHQEMDGFVVIAPAGEVDLYTSPELRKAILAASKKKTDIKVDLRDVGYMDSSGVATLVEGLQGAGKTGKSFVLTQPSHAVMKVLQLARLDSVFTIEEAD
jgi:anti-sigma B factor antagonist